MMNSGKDYERMLNLASAYKARLSTVDEEIFQQTPPIGGWSLSEVYFHIFDASLLSLETLNECIKGNGKDRPTAFIVKMILFFGSLPPVKYKAPKSLADRLTLVSKDEALKLIEAFVEQLNITYPKLTTASKAIKTKHPRMGYLNAFQWFRFTEIHLKHHYKQIIRIEKSFK